MSIDGSALAFHGITLLFFWSGMKTIFIPPQSPTQFLDHTNSAKELLLAICSGVTPTLWSGITFGGLGRLYKDTGIKLVSAMYKANILYTIVPVPEKQFCLISWNVCLHSHS